MEGMPRRVIVFSVFGALRAALAVGARVANEFTGFITVPLRAAFVEADCAHRARDHQAEISFQTQRAASSLRLALDDRLNVLMRSKLCIEFNFTRLHEAEIVGDASDPEK
jgi:hypothetical protein